MADNTKLMRALQLAGIAPPASLSASSGVPNWYDPSKGSVGNPLAGVNSFQGTGFIAPTTGNMGFSGHGNASEYGALPDTQGQITDPWGQGHQLTANPDGTYGYSDQFNDPSGQSNRDQLGVQYNYDPKTGQVTPRSAGSFYQPGDWVDKGQSLATLAAVMATAGIGGGLYGASAAGAEGAAAPVVGGTNLFADGAIPASYGTGGGAGLATGGGQAAGAAFGTGAQGSVAANVGGQLGASSLADQAAVGGGTNLFADGAIPASYGGGGAAAAAPAASSLVPGLTDTQLAQGATGLAGTASGGGGGGSSDIANTGSDAHFYQPQAGNIGVQDLGNSGGAGTSSIPSWQYGSDGLSGLNGSNASQLANLLKGGVGTGLAGLAAGAVANHQAGNLNIPDYRGAAQAQGDSGRVDQSNAWGNLNYTPNGVDAQGNPVYKQNVSLNPADQANLDQARSGQSAALGGLNNSIAGYGAALKAVPGLYGDTGSQAGLATQARDAMYHQQTALLDPQYQEQQRSLQSQLTNQGVAQGSQAWNQAMDSYARQRDYAYGNARDSSINQGNAYANQLFGQNLQAHQTGVNDLNTQQNQYLTDANNLGNTVRNPTFQSTSSPTNYLGAASLQGQGNLNQYNAQTGNANSTQNGLFTLGSSLLSNPAWSQAIGSLFSTGGG